MTYPSFLKWASVGLTIIWVNFKPTPLSHTTVSNGDNECILIVLWWDDIFQRHGKVPEFSTVLIIQAWLNLPWISTSPFKDLTAFWKRRYLSYKRMMNDKVYNKSMVSKKLSTIRAMLSHIFNVSNCIVLNLNYISLLKMINIFSFLKY